MDKQEFLLLIPAIIYGVAIVDLLKIFGHKKNYYELVGWGSYVMLAVIFVWVELYNKLDLITSSNLTFVLIIGQAILISQAATVITPENEDDDTEAYFLKSRKLFFLLLAASSLYGMLMQYFVYDDHTPSWLRPLAIALYLIAGFSNKKWLRTIVLMVVLSLAVLVVFTDRIM